MSYAATTRIYSNPVKAMFFGLMRRTEAAQLVRDVRDDMYRSNVETFADSCREIAAIARTAKRPTATANEAVPEGASPRG